MTTEYSIVSWMTLVQDFRAKLAAEHDQRNDRPLTWEDDERAAMLRYVNKVRAQRQRPPATIDDVIRVERHALGHSDYGSKFALYCAELAVETGPLWVRA